MRKKILMTFLGLMVLFAPVGGIKSGALSSESGEVSVVPVKGMVTMVDLGAAACIPCKLMAPILRKLEKVYKEKAAIIFIDVCKYRDQAQRFGIRAIPTQIFFNKEGEEVYRHVGFMSEKAIIEQLNDMGVSQSEIQDTKKLSRL